MARFGGRVAISAGLLVGLIWFTGLGLRRDFYSSVSIEAYALAALLSAAGTIVVPALLTRVALRIDRISLSLGYLIQLNFAMRFYAIILPRAASIAIRWYRYGLASRPSDSLALMAFERAIQLLVFIFAAALLLGAEQLAGKVDAPALLIGLGVFVALLLAFALAFLSQKALTVFQILLRPLMRFFGTRLSGVFEKLRDAVRAFQRLTTLDRTKIVALAVFSYILFVASAWVLARAMELPVDVFGLGWIRPIVFFATLIPIAVGGIGLREGAFIALLPLYGVPAATALEFSLVLFSIQLLLAAGGAVAETGRFMNRRHGRNAHGVTRE